MFALPYSNKVAIQHEYSRLPLILGASPDAHDMLDESPGRFVRWMGVAFECLPVVAKDPVPTERSVLSDSVAVLLQG